MKLPPFKVTKPVVVERDPRTDEAILTVLGDTNLGPGYEQHIPVILILSPAARRSLLVALQALETSPDNPSAGPNTPGSLQ